MKVHIDLIHPANIHYFKYFIWNMKERGHQVNISARKKDVLQKLLEAYGLPYYDMGVGTIGSGAIGKALYLIKAFIKIFTYFLQTKPDIVLSFGSTPCAYACFILRVPHIAFEDTEHAKLNRKLYAPISQMVCTPMSFYENIGKLHFRFNGYMELFYLHKNRFKANSDILREFGLHEHSKFVFMRFVSWGAYHDIGQKGLSTEQKVLLVRELEKICPVFISAEGAMPKELQRNEIKISPEKVHDLMSFAALYIGEGATMASECAMLGVPSIYINSLPLMGYLIDARNAGLLFYLHEYSDIHETAVSILSSSQSNYKEKRDNFLKDKIDPTAMLLWLVENYPASKQKLLSNPSYQDIFK